MGSCVRGLGNGAMTHMVILQAERMAPDAVDKPAGGAGPVAGELRSGGAGERRRQRFDGAAPCVDVGPVHNACEAQAPAALERTYTPWLSLRLVDSTRRSPLTSRPSQPRRLLATTGPACRAEASAIAER